MSLSQDEILKELFRLSKKLGKVPFSLVLKVSSGYNVIPVDLSNNEDKELIMNIENTLKKFLKTIRSSQPAFKGRRINDVGRKIEPQIVHELDGLPLKVEQLGKSGYPDMKIIFNDKVSYLEMKTTSVQGKSNLRTFYYTDGKKIKADAHHLLLTIFASPDERDGYWKVENLTLSDLSSLSVKLKAEFNASKTDLMDKKAKLFMIK